MPSPDIGSNVALADSVQRARERLSRTRSSQERGDHVHACDCRIGDRFRSDDGRAFRRAGSRASDARPAVQDVASKPIGKVVVATGSVTLERAGAVVVQASTAGQAGQAKVGDLVYQGDAVATGADGKVGINFTDGTSFNLSNNARMVLNEFVYDPNSTSNSSLDQSDQGNFHLCRRQSREDRRYEDRHPGRDHGHSRHHATRRNFG